MEYSSPHTECVDAVASNWAPLGRIFNRKEISAAADGGARGGWQSRVENKQGFDPPQPCQAMFVCLFLYLFCFVFLIPTAQVESQVQCGSAWCGRGRG